MKPVTPAAAGLVLAAALAPIVATAGLFLYDVPNHIFRSQLIADLVSGKTSSFYYFELKPIPNLPIDVVSLLVGRFLDGTVMVAGLTVVGCAGFYLAILHWRRAAGRSTSLWLCLLSLLVLYSMPLAEGLIHYLLGVGLMLLAVARLERRQPAAELWLPQLVLVVLMYFCSAVPVMDYFIWAGGTALYDLAHAQREERRGVVGHAALVHGPALAAVAALMLAVDPTYPIEGAARVFWSLGGRIDGITSLGRMLNFPHEFAFPFILYGTLAVMFWSGWLRLQGRSACGVALLLAYFIVSPTEIRGAALVDSRQMMAIVGVLLANVEEGAPAARLRARAVCRWVIAVLVVLRFADLALGWIPTQMVARSYAALARRVPDRSTVAFVYYAADRDPAPRIAEWLESWKRARSLRDLLGPETIYLYNDFWHLHMAPFRGRDVLMSNVFPNFSVHPRPGLHFRMMVTPFDHHRVASVLSSDPYDYVISHADLSELPLQGKCVCLLAQSGSVRLYHLLPQQPSVAGALPTCGCSQLAGVALAAPTCGTRRISSPAPAR